LWIDVLLFNRGPVTEALQATEGSLAELRRLLTAGDADGLRGFLTEGQRFREALD
jgi:prephenate dehydrogenase